MGSAAWHRPRTPRRAVTRGRAGEVPAAAGAVVLIALAVLLPLGLAGLAFARVWRRHRREAALEP